MFACPPFTILQTKLINLIFIENIRHIKINQAIAFGAFVQISPAVEALVHVSEMGEGSDVDPEKIFVLNERKDFKVLDIDKEGRKISLSFVGKKKK